MIVSFCGHRRIENQDVKEWLYEVVERSIQAGANIFYLGGYGWFDHLCADVCTQLKKTYPTIQRVLVIPYLDRKYDKSNYDDFYYPNLESVPKRFAISKRNQAMVNEADILISYVQHDLGSGAYKTLQYAIRKQKIIFRYPDTTPMSVINDQQK